MRRLLFIVFFISAALPAFAQWECRSQLSSNLKPVGKSKLYWASEITLGSGYLTNNAILNSMGFIGLDYSFKNSSIFAETGYKYWYRADFDLKSNFRNGHFGVREFFYQYKSKGHKIITGIQSATFDDYFLLNERMLGVNYKFTNGKFTLNFNAGSVLKGFSRNGLFCSVGYLYDVIYNRNLPLTGGYPGETNLAGISVKYTFVNNSESEFSDDTTPVSLRIKDIGFVLYSEFGTLINKSVYFPALFMKVEFPAGFTFKPELLYQISNGNDLLIYDLKFETNIVSTKKKFHANIRYIGSYKIDESAVVLNSFSNLFLGDVLRLDSRDGLPLLQIGSRISFPKIKTHLKLQYSLAAGSLPLSEINFEYGKRFAKSLQMVAVTGLIKDKQRDRKLLLGRVELRISL